MPSSWPAWGMMSNEVERAAPDVVDLGVAELGIDVDHAAAQDGGAPADRLISLGKERGAAPEQHAAVRSEAIVVKIVLRVVDHPVARAEVLRQLLRQHFGCNDER